MSLVRYYEDNRRYADLINGFLFQGEQVITEGDIEEKDSREVGVTSDTEKHFKQIYRDMVRKVILGMNVVIVAIENQEEIHYAMPVRILYGDALAYQKQMERIQKHHREHKDWKSSSEFLGKFHGEDKLQPVVSIVIYYGEKSWDGARDLYDLLNLEDIPEEMRRFINHYPIHILDVRRFRHTEWFQSDIREVFEFIQCLEDKEKIKGFVEKRKDRLADMEEDACEVMEFVAKTKAISFRELKYRNAKGGIDMCKGLEDWGKELEEIGRQRGQQQGIQEGMQQGIQQGIQEGIQQGLRLTSAALFQYGMTAEEFSKKYQIAIEIVKDWYEEWTKEKIEAFAGS